MQKDRRRHQRKAIPIPIRIYAGTRWLAATVMDISPDGIRIRLEEEVPLSRRLGLRMAHRGETFGLKVCWSQGPEAGCAFLEPLDTRRYNRLMLEAVTV